MRSSAGSERRLEGFRAPIMPHSSGTRSSAYTALWPVVGFCTFRTQVYSSLMIFSQHKHHVLPGICNLACQPVKAKDGAASQARTLESSHLRLSLLSIS
jgi:L-cysteine desulfidase